MRDNERGQAILETVLFVPLFLLTLFGIFLIVSEGSMSERVQLGVRNGGLIAAEGDPYLSYSSYNLYSSIDGVDPADPNANCNGAVPDTSLLSASRKSFWKPAATASAPAGTCVYSKGIVSIGGTYFPLQSDYLSLSVQTAVNPYLVGNIVPNSTISTKATQNFLRPGTIGQLLQESSIGASIKASLEASNDFSTIQNCTGYNVCPGNVGQQPVTVPTASYFPSPPSITTTLAPRASSTPASSATSIASYSPQGA
jgi:hypothetical protein